MRKKVICLSLAFFTALSGICGCAGSKETEGGLAVRQGSTDPNCQYDTFITVDVFSKQSNFQGIQSGWFGEYVKQKFNMELNIIAPNVAGGGDTLLQTRSAAGDLGDLIITDTANGRFQDLVSAGLIQDMRPYLSGEENLNKCTGAVEAFNGSLVKEEGVWGIPSDISFRSADTPSDGNEPTFGPYLRWEVYKAAGSPEIKDLDGLLEVLADMQAAYPKTESGKQVYALSLFKDWDDNLLSNVKPLACYYGYDELGFVLAKADGSDYQGLIDENSPYVKALRFCFKANQMGILDPESTTQNYDILFDKYKEGRILFSLWPWLGQSAFNTKERMDAGEGFVLIPIKNMQIHASGCYSKGDYRIGVMLGSKAEDPQRLVDFIDWLYSPEGVSVIGGGIGGTAGPEGLTWEIGADGKPALTDIGKKAFYEGDTDIPPEWGTGSWKNGVCQLGLKSLCQTDQDPKTGEPYRYQLWDSVKKQEETSLSRQWKEVYGADSTMEYLTDNQLLLVAPGSGYVQPEEDSEITALRNQCKTTIVDFSWKMIFAEDEEEFERLLGLMQEEALGLGYDQVYEVDLANALAQQQARKEAVEQAP